MDLTTDQLKQIIQEEVNRADKLANEKQERINEIVSIIQSLNETQLTSLHENLKRYK